MAVIYAGIASYGFGVLLNLRGKKLWTAAIGGGLGWLVYVLCAAQGAMAQNFFASLAITLYAEGMARLQRAPVLVYLIPALIPLVPGGLIYQTMLYALKEEAALFFETGGAAALATGAVALGIAAATSLARLLALRPAPKEPK